MIDQSKQQGGIILDACVLIDYLKTDPYDLFVAADSKMGRLSQYDILYFSTAKKTLPFIGNK
jgi:hypothetical protein